MRFISDTVGKRNCFAQLWPILWADLKNIIELKRPADLSAVSDNDLIRAWEMDESYMMWWFRFLYERKDGFLLLLKCAEGTSYRNFQHDWVDEMTSATNVYYEESYRRKLANTDISKSELHILLTAFWTTIYEPFIHGYTWEQIEAHCKLVCGLFDWQSVFRFRTHT